MTFRVDFVTFSGESFIRDYSIIDAVNMVQAIAIIKRDFGENCKIIDVSRVICQCSSYGRASV